MRLAEPLLGSAYGVRSPDDDDARFTVALRSDAEISRYLHRASGDLNAQLAWQRRALERDDDVPLIVFHRATRAAEGTAGLYNIDWRSGRAEWGRWIVRTGSRAAVESAILVYTLAFDVLRLHMVYCRTLAANARTVAFHDRAGLQRTQVGRMHLDGAEVGFIEHTITATVWPGVRRRLQPVADRVAARPA